ncbi:MAG: DMT family transporter [Candidatus Methanomethylophilaceae archaeon]|nr:DMT family transporter [Candidatus Methanomethylophilaceae archaeon]
MNGPSANSANGMQSLPSSIDDRDIIPLLILGLLNTGFGCLLYFTSIGRIEAQTVAICDYLEPASALFFAMLLLGETASIEEIIGMALIAAGVIIGSNVRCRSSKLKIDGELCVEMIRRRSGGS